MSTHDTSEDSKVQRDESSPRKTGLTMASPSDLLIRRDDTGRPSAVVERVPGTDMTMRVIPMTNGEIERYRESVLESQNPDDEQTAELFNRHLADLDVELTAEDIGGDGDNAVPGYLVGPWIQLIKNASGLEAHEGFIAERLAAMKGLDIETIRGIQALMDEATLD